MRLRMLYSLVLVSICAAALPASAADIPLTDKLLCRVEEGKAPALVKAGSLKTAKFASALNSADKKVKNSQDALKRLVASRASQSKIKNAKAKVAAAKAEKKNISLCKKGKISESNQPTPPNSDPGKVAGTVEIYSYDFSIREAVECLTVVFIKWPAKKGEEFKEITYTRGNRPGVPGLIKNEVKKTVSAPYDDNYVDRLLSGTPTGFVLNAEEGFHQVRVNRGETRGDECSDSYKEKYYAELKSDFGDIFAHKK